MPDWSLLEGQRYTTYGANLPFSRGAAATANATANTKGVWAVLIAATTAPADWLLIQIDYMGSGQDHLTDIGIGAAGVEVVIAANLYTGSAAAETSATGYYYVPIHIPTATRLAARTQATLGSNIVRAQVLGMGSGVNQNMTAGRVTTYGAATADSGGTSIDPGATANTKGAWAQITAATTRPISSLNIAFGNQKNTARTDATWLVDVGVGAAGVEQVVLPDLWVQAHTSDDQISPQSMTFPISIPTATRLAVRAQCSITDATDRLFDSILYGAD